MEYSVKFYENNGDIKNPKMILDGMLNKMYKHEEIMNMIHSKILFYKDENNDKHYRLKIMDCLYNIHLKAFVFFVEISSK